MTRTKKAARTGGHQNDTSRKGARKKLASNKIAREEIPSPHSFVRDELELLQRMLGLLPQRQQASLRDVVFVCIDCEASELMRDKVTEIGVAVLDTRDLAGINPGQDAAGWLGKADHTHYRIIEHAQLRNRVHWRGCEHGFSRGVTRWISKDDASNVLGRVFEDPSRSIQASDFWMELSSENRNIIAVGHDLFHSQKLLKCVGFTVSEKMAYGIDTAEFARLSRRVNVGLRGLLSSLDIEPVNLNNTGNTAAYTLEALIIMAFRDAKNPGSVFSGLSTQPVRLPNPAYNNVAAPYILAGSLERNALAAATAAAASKAPGVEFYRKSIQRSTNVPAEDEDVDALESEAPDESNSGAQEQAAQDRAGGRWNLSLIQCSLQ